MQIHTTTVAPAATNPAEPEVILRCYSPERVIFRGKISGMTLYHNGILSRSKDTVLLEERHFVSPLSELFSLCGAGRGFDRHGYCKRCGKLHDLPDFSSEANQRRMRDLLKDNDWRWRWIEVSNRVPLLRLQSQTDYLQISGPLSKQTAFMIACVFLFLPRSQVKWPPKLFPPPPGLRQNRKAMN